MSQFSANDSSQQRDTKNVYFFKSGDHSFNGVKVPVNLRKHRNLDALLDDLSRRVPGLSHGVRQLRTPHGRTLITNLEQLEHGGGYVCSEKINTTVAVPGVDFRKMKNLNLKDFQVQDRSTRIPQPLPDSPKKKLKKKKKKKKIKKGVLEEQQNGTNVTNVITGETQIRNFEDQLSAEDEIDENGLNDSKLAESVALNEALDEIEHEYDDEQLALSKNQDENAEEIEGQQGNDKVSYSAPGTPLETRRLESASLSPLDDKKIAHVQRRRISSKQINVEEYTLPTAKSSASMKSEIFSMKSVDEGDDKVVRGKPPRSKPSSAASNKSFDEDEAVKAKSEIQMERSLSIFDTNRVTTAGKNNLK